MATSWLRWGKYEEALVQHQKSLDIKIRYTHPDVAAPLFRTHTHTHTHTHTLRRKYQGLGQKLSSRDGSARARLDAGGPNPSKLTCVVRGCARDLPVDHHRASAGVIITIVFVAALN